jgi:hypothetical protein
VWKWCCSRRTNRLLEALPTLVFETFDQDWQFLVKVQGDVAVADGAGGDLLARIEYPVVANC